MTKIVLTLFLIGHVLGDFYFQSSRLAMGKDESFRRLLEHSGMYLISMMLVIIPVFSNSMLKWALFISLSHFIVDSLKFYIKKKNAKDNEIEALTFSIDQIIHIMVIVFIYLYLYYMNENIVFIYNIQFVLDRLQINISNILSWILIVLIINQPFSITIRKLLYRYRPTVKEERNGISNAGAFIGMLERSIILLMLSAGQYAAIGFVLTAKSIARYGKIVEDPEFSEYYLLGTLLSTMLVIIAYLVIF